MMLLFFFAFIATTSIASAGSFEPRVFESLSVPNGRIVGGYIVDIKEFPHQISLRYNFNGVIPFDHRCGGSIIGDNVILTAAHCVYGLRAAQFIIVAGTNNCISSDGVSVAVQKIIVNKNYSPTTLVNDIAILRLVQNLPINNFTIRTIELAEERPSAGVISTVTGWGATTEAGLASDRLRAVNVSIITNEDCNLSYEGQVTDSMLCAGVPDVGGKDSCQGDSGGPLITNGQLIGIVSWGNGCARSEYPGVYTSVPYLYKFIQDSLANDTLF